MDNYSKERVLDGSIGIDLGLTSFLVSSDNVLISSLRSLKKHEKILKKAQRKLSKKQHPRTKDDARKGVVQSNNYIKQKERVSKIHLNIARAREDFLHKLSTHLVKHYKYIAVEDLDVKELLSKKILSKFISDASWSRFITMLEYKSKIYGSRIVMCDRYMPSTKMCSNCGEVKPSMSLWLRKYECEQCGLTLDRDYNASLNLLNQMKQKIGEALPELTPAEMQVMISSLKKNNLSYSIAEPGIKTKSLKSAAL